MQTQTLNDPTFAEVLALETCRAETHYDVDATAKEIDVRLRRPAEGYEICSKTNPSQIEILLPNGLWYQFGPYGQDQFLQKVGVPVIYARKCLRTSGMDSELLADVVGWLGRSDDTWKFRCDRRGRTNFSLDTVRGVVSERYVPFDNVDLLNALAPIVEARDLRVEALRQDDGHMNLRLLMANPMEAFGYTDPEASDIKGGYVVRNSEIRLAAVSVAALVYRVICTNGLIAPVGDQSIFRQIHYGQPAERVRAMLPEAIQQVDRQQEVMFTAYAEKSHEIFTLSDAVRIASRIGKGADLNKGEVEALIKIVSDDAARTLPAESEELQEIGGFTFVNAMTRYAHTSDLHFARQDRLESEIGRFVLSQ